MISLMFSLLKTNIKYLLYFFFLLTHEIEMIFNTAILLLQIQNIQNINKNVN